MKPITDMSSYNQQQNANAERLRERQDAEERRRARQVQAEMLRLKTSGYRGGTPVDSMLGWLMPDSTTASVRGEGSAPPAFQSNELLNETPEQKRKRLTRSIANMEPQVVEPVDTSALREAAGYRLAAEGLDATDFGLSPDMAEGSADNTIEDSGPTVDQMTGRSLLRRALEASRKPIDMQRFEQLAQDRNRAGDLSTLSSLYAGEAGPRYDDYKKRYLTKALEEQDQKQLGDYGFASGGQFYETPGIQEAREAETDMAGAELLFDAEEADARRLNKTLTANQYSKLMAEADTDQVALDQLDQVLATFEVLDGGADRGFTVWTDQVTANAKNFFGKQASRDEFRLMSRDAKLQQIIGLFRTEIVGPGIVTEYDAERILKSVGGNVGAFQNPDIVREQLDILRQQKLKALATKKRQLDYFGRAYPGLYGSVAAPSGLSLGANDADAGQEIFESNF